MENNSSSTSSAASVSELERASENQKESHEKEDRIEKARERKRGRHDHDDIQDPKVNAKGSPREISIAANPKESAKKDLEPKREKEPKEKEPEIPRVTSKPPLERKVSAKFARKRERREYDLINPDEVTIDNVKDEVVITRRSSRARFDQVDSPPEEFKVKVLDPDHSVYVTFKDRLNHFTLFPHHSQPKANEFHGLRAKTKMGKEAHESLWAKPQCYLPRRFIMIALMVFVAAINYMMRTVMSVAVVPMAAEQRWSSETKGLVLSSFFWGYIITQIPGGLLVQRFGAKMVLLAFVLVSGGLTIAFPFTVNSVPLAIFMRVLFGIFQGPSHPTFTQTIAYWFPKKEKSMMNALIAAGYVIGQVVAMGVTGPIHSVVGWRVAFFLYGSLVVLWAAFWIGFFVNKPHDNGFCCRIGTRELATILHFRGSPSLKEKGYGSESKDSATLFADASESDETKQKGKEMDSEGNGRTTKEKSKKNQKLSASESSKNPEKSQNSSTVGNESYSELVREAKEADGGRSDTESKSKSGSEMAMDGDGRESKKKNHPKKKKQEKIPWLAIFSSRSYISVCVALFAQNWTTYVALSWLPSYMRQQFNFNIDQVGFYSLLPMLIKGIVSIIAGLSSEKLLIRFPNTTALRKVFQAIAFFVPIASFLLLSFVPGLGPGGSITLLCLAIGSSAFTTVGAEGVNLDMSTKYAGVMMSFANTIATIPGIIGVYLAGYILETTKQQWWIVFTLAACVSSVAVVVFLIWASSDEVDFDEVKKDKL